RGTPAPKTASRAERLRGTKGLSVGKDPAHRQRGLRVDLRVRAVVVASSARGAMDRLELLEAAAGADRDAGERALGEVDRHLRLVAEPLVQAVQEGAATGEDDATVHDVGRELGRGLVERRLDRVDDLGDRAVEGAAHLFAAQ